MLAAPGFTQVKSYKEIKTPALRTLNMPQPKRMQLANGMVILLMEDHELPLIRGSALIHGGSRDVPADKAGLVGILAGAWRTGGTQSKTGDQLDDFLESRAARVETGGDEDSTAVRLDVLKDDFDTVFPIFLEILQQSGVPPGQDRSREDAAQHRHLPPQRRAADDPRPRAEQARLRRRARRTRGRRSTPPSPRSRATISSRSTSASSSRTTSSSASAATSTPRRWRRSCATRSRRGRKVRRRPLRRRR